MLESRKLDAEKDHGGGGNDAPGRLRRRHRFLETSGHRSPRRRRWPPRPADDGAGLPFSIPAPPSFSAPSSRPPLLLSVAPASVQVPPWVSRRPVTACTIAAALWGLGPELQRVVWPARSAARQARIQRPSSGSAVVRKRRSGPVPAVLWCSGALLCRGSLLPPA